jgi:Asp-tRNA(Asn)/Glu-tRNA(Gln) amidotransferase A subunit family amidase
MSMRDELELLEQIQIEAEAIGEELEETSGVNRREFVFLTLAAAAASTFGFGARALAQGAAGGGAGGAGAAAQPAPIALGNGDPVSWTFQPYPGGTGALMEKLIAERGAAAFRRSPFTVARWSGPVPTDPVDIAYLPAHRLSALLRERRVTSTQLTRIYLERIKRLDPTLLCAVTIMEEQALAEAARADAEIAAGRYRGPLHGIPYGVKDLFSTKGVRTTWGSRDFEGRIIDEDAEVVVRLRNAGAVLMAKLATGLFASGANWYRGRTNNPWDIRRGSSGSSAGVASATAAGCVAFGIGTETSGSIVSPSRECGLSALRPTFGRVSRYGGMVLAWSQDRVGPMCRTIEDCAMVFNAIHGVDPKDPGTVTTPFEFERNINLASLRIGVAENAPAELVAKLRELGATPTPIGDRPSIQGGGGLGVESAAAFDFYVEMKAKELGLDVAALDAERAAAAAAGRGRGGGGRGRGGRGGGADSTAAGGRGALPDSAAGRGGAPADTTGEGRGGRGGGRGGGGDPGNPTGVAAINRWMNGRTPRAMDFIQAQRRRHVLISRMQEFLKDLDLYIPTEAGDVGLHAQTGHPCAVVQYKFESPPAGRGGRGGGRGGRGGADPDTTAAAGRAGGPPAEPPFNPKPICAVIAGNLYNDDKILSVAHKYQVQTDWHLRRPNIG